jgi:osmoprotectant transport system permease protein
VRAPLLLLALVATAQAAPKVTVGSKKFTEAVVLGEMAAHLARAAGAQVEHRRDLGGTQVLWKALLAGDVDVYAEYTGTLREEILRDTPGLLDPGDLRRALAERGVEMSAPLGFNDTYALAMRADAAERLGARRLSDLAAHPELRLRFSDEFLKRADGWPAVQQAYGLPQRDVVGLDHDLAYRGIAAGDADVVDVYSTDAEIAWYHLRVLDDDRGHFPRYDAVLLWRHGLAPEVVASLRRLEGRIGEAEMAALNARAKLERVPEAVVAADFLREKLGLEVAVATEGRAARLLRLTGQHLFLVGVSLLAAILVAVPLGIFAARRPRFGQVVLAAVGVVQTIPSLALLVFMIPLFGIGAGPALVALFLYSLLPIVRNTHAGLNDIPAALRESAEALGLPPGARLRRVELPLATRAILAGIKTSAVINVGTATLGALIGAGGYGQPILTGIRLDDVGLILEGAVPAALLALVVQGLFEIAERRLVPRGLRG